VKYREAIEKEWSSGEPVIFLSGGSSPKGLSAGGDGTFAHRSGKVKQIRE
jgi:hypothetical protein